MSWNRAVYGLSAIGLSWLLMQAVHEAGHVLAGLAVGDRIDRVVLHPLAVSRTDLSPGSQPLVTTAAGPLFGALAPLLVCGVSAANRWPLSAWLRFFAGFCLVANGAYLGIAPLAAVGDAEVLLQHGAPRWMLAAFGLVAGAAGLRLWHGLGPAFGWGANAPAITGRQAVVAVCVLAAVVALECALSPRM